MVVVCYKKYGEKIEELQSKALEDSKEEEDFTGPLIKSFQLKQEKLKLFLEPTEQAILESMYIKKFLKVIKNSNYINKVVLKLRA